ncbi:MAG: amidohydrolase [Bacteroidales bacterium]
MADLIITNARIWTGDPARPSAEAIAIQGARVAALGTATEIDEHRTRATRVVDARGRRVVPGFIDAHLHVPWGALQLRSVDLKDARSASDFVERIAARVQAAAGEWVQGGGWDEQAWTPPTLPTRDLIDPISPTTPVFVKRYDVHAALANTVALRLAGVTDDTPDPPGGTIVRDERGRPTGVLKDAATQFVQRVIPAPSPLQRRRDLLNALAEMRRAGITSAHDMNPSADDLRAYVELANRGELTTRLYAVPLETEWIAARRAGGMVDALDSLSPSAESYLRSRAVKGFSDGSLGSGTAYFFEPYCDDPGNFGLLSEELRPMEDFRARLVEADAAGRQLCMHAIGDRAVAIMLDLFADVRRQNGARDRRLRIEHAQHLVPGDFARFKALDVMASVQPYHLIDDGRWAERRIGPHRLDRAFAFRTFLEHGVRLAFGTDWPVAPLNPMLTLHAAVTRATLDGRNPDGWVPAQKLSVAEALEAYTLGAAFAEGAEAEKGSLAAGKWADLVVLSDDILAIDPARIPDVRVEMTLAGGRIVHGEDE